MTQNPSALIHLHDADNTSRRGGGMVVPNFFHERSDSTHLGDGKCIYHFTPLVQCRVGDLALTDYLWLW